MIFEISHVFRAVSISCCTQKSTWRSQTESTVDAKLITNLLGYGCCSTLRSAIQASSTSFRGSYMKNNVMMNRLADAYGPCSLSGRLGTPDTHCTPGSPSGRFGLPYGTASETRSFARQPHHAQKTQRHSHPTFNFFCLDGQHCDPTRIVYRLKRSSSTAARAIPTADETILAGSRHTALH